MNEYGWLLAIGAVMAAGWQQLRGIVAALVSKVIVTVRLDYRIGPDVIAHLRRNARTLTHRNVKYTGVRLFVRPLGRVRMVAVRDHLYASYVFLLGRWPVTYTMQTERDGPDQYVLSFLRGTVDVDRLVVDALEEAHRVGGVGGFDCRFKVIHKVGGSRNLVMQSRGSDEPPGAGKREQLENDPDVVGWKREDIGEPKPASPIGHLVLSDDVQSAYDDAVRWGRSSDWYHRHGLVWKRGYLLAGPAGTGKTSLAKAVAQTLDLPVYAFDLSSLSNSEFTTAWEDMLSESPCVALFEDVDAVFQGRKNVVPEHTSGGLTFDCLLARLDGVEQSEGVLTFVTTNHLPAVDDALKRPGRLDKIVATRPFSEGDARKYVERRLGFGAWPIREWNGSMTPAELQEVCSARLLQDEEKT